MKLVDACYDKVKKNCFKYIKSQETVTNRFINKEDVLLKRMHDSSLIAKILNFAPQEAR